MPSYASLTRLILLLALATAHVLADEEPLRLAVLHALFPQMKISLEPAKRINHSWPAKPPGPPRPSYPDAFAPEPVYRVIGRPDNEVEHCASENLLTNTFSHVRELRLKLLPWPGKPKTDLLVAAQYKFRDANPAGSCWSIGLLVRLTKTSATWHRRESYLLETQHHTSIQRVELLNLDATALPQLVVESNFGGALTLGSTLQVFHLANGKFDEILNTQSRLEYDVEEAYTQELDIPKTRSTRFRLKKTTHLEKGTWFNPPRVSHVHFNHGAGVDKASQRLRQQMLTPLK